MFRVVETIFGVAIRESKAAVWHPSVRFFDVVDRSGEIVGQFYLDLYARTGKRGGAWMDEAIGRRRRGATVQHPVAYLTCNFSAPIDGKSALFTHDEVTTLFHEFGHGLHLLLTRIDVPGVSGLDGVEWDAVELPSQFMENFCWEWDVLKHMTSHVDTAPRCRAYCSTGCSRQRISRAECRPFVRSSSRCSTCICITTSPDHGEHAAGAGGRGPAGSGRGLRARPDDRSLTHSFSHIFAGGYAAGYYSYKWAEVLSADAFSLFEERGVLSPAAGARFRDEVLARVAAGRRWSRSSLSAAGLPKSTRS